MTFLRIHLLIIGIIASTTLFCQTTNVLFIGNSYTSYNNLPLLTKNIALSFNDTIYTDSNAPGGYTFNNHSTNTTTLNKISLGTWDYVIIQGQSQEPSFPPSQVQTQTYPYAANLVNWVYTHNPCATTLLYMTWGRQNGDASNCANYAPLCTFDGMNARLRESYLEMAFDNDAEVSPVGAAWKYVRDNFPSINLYNADQSHPSLEGSYLAACVHYAMMFKKSPVGATFISTLNSTVASNLQLAAKLVVIDSLEKWNANVRKPKADFSYSNVNTTYTFSNNSINTTSYIWHFGDGATSTDENPIHNFTSNGTYSVKLIAQNQCTVDSITTIVTVTSTTSSIESTSNPTIQFYTNGDEWLLENLKWQKSILSVYNYEGKLIDQISIGFGKTKLQKPNEKGFYIIVVNNNEQNFEHSVFKATVFE